MLLSRSAVILKSANQFKGIQQTAANLKQVRNVWCYRKVPPPDTKWIITTECVAGVVWWWVLWNFWHDFDRITGHFEYPRPCDWSDEELGIPPDEVD